MPGSQLLFSLLPSPPILRSSLSAFSLLSCTFSPLAKEVGAPNDQLMGLIIKTKDTQFLGAPNDQLMGHIIKTKDAQFLAYGTQLYSRIHVYFSLTLPCHCHTLSKPEKSLLEIISSLSYISLSYYSMAICRANAPNRPSRLLFCQVLWSVVVIW